MTDLFSYRQDLPVPPPAAPPTPPPEPLASAAAPAAATALARLGPSPRWSIGDRVKPAPGWEPRDPHDRILPAGAVVSVEPVGKGQVIRVGDDPRAHVAGCFVRDEPA